MADRRMFSMKVIDSDAFLDMPLSTQALYFHLSMRADDDGFVANPRKIRQMIGASDDDVKILIAKRYILTFDSGVIVIKHWRIHNYIQKDRYNSTTYVEEKSTLKLDSKNAYTECLDTDCIQNGYKMDTQVRLGKISIGKNKEEIYKEENATNVARDYFKKPSIEDVKAYCTERNNGIDAESFINFYESKGWYIGKNKMKDWKACVRTWERTRKLENSHKRDFDEREYTQEEIDSFVSNIDEEVDL